MSCSNSRFQRSDDRNGDLTDIGNVRSLSSNVQSVLVVLVINHTRTNRLQADIEVGGIDGNTVTTLEFGQEYRTLKDFKREFKAELKKACAVYPDAKISDESGGIRLYPSKPPVPKSQVLVLEDHASR